MLGTQMEWTEGETERERVEKRKGGNRRVWELMLTTDVCHSSLVAVTLFLALYQSHNRRNSCTIYILKPVSKLNSAVRLNREMCV